MKDLKDTCRVAVVQCAPVMFDKKAGTEKMVELIREAGKNGAELIVFPELFIPGYPYGMTFGFTVGSRTAPGRKDWGLYYDNSILVPGPETEILGRAAREARSCWDRRRRRSTPMSASACPSGERTAPRCITPTSYFPRMGSC